MICSPRTQELVDGYKESIKIGFDVEKYKTIHQSHVEINPYSIEQQVKQKIDYLIFKLLQLEKYDNYYVKIEDVLNLFLAKKE
jgi:hypothetical protein